MRLAISSLPIAEAAEYGKCGSAAAHRSQVLDECKQCGRWFKNLVRHTPHCRPVAPKPPRGHAACVRCGRLVKIGETECFTCSGSAEQLATAMGCRL